MSVWLCIPSKRPPAEAGPRLMKWRERGYKIALFLDEKPTGSGPWNLSLNGEYPGYAAATNDLIALVMLLDPTAEWFVIGGDDIDPDPNVTADEIAAECKAHFSIIDMPVGNGASTFGVMQPTGDRWGESDQSKARHGSDRGAYIDRICGSAWLGREFCRRVNLGKGPLWPEYFHMFVDEELQAVVERLGILWQRRDLIQFHHHWGRQSGATRETIPDFLQEVNKTKHWDDSKAIFERRQAAGFPGTELIA